MSVDLTTLSLAKRLLVIGDSRTGKTRFGGTLCGLMPTVVVTADLEGTADTLVGMGVKDVELVHVQDWERSWEYLGRLRDLAATHPALFVDDFGKIQDTTEGRLLAVPRNRAETEMRRGFDDYRRAATLRGDRTLDLRQYGYLAAAMDAWLTEIRALPYRVTLFTVLPEVRSDPRDGGERIFPAVAGSLRYELGSYFSLVANTFIEHKEGKTHYCMTTLPHPRLPTGERYGQARTWVNPTAARLLRHITGKEADGDKETDEERKIGVGIYEVSGRRAT